MGRFAYESETDSNPSVPTFFVAMTGDKGYSRQDFVQRWNDRGISKKHARFEQAVDTEKAGYFKASTESIQDKVFETLFPIVYRKDLGYRLSSWLGSNLDLEKGLWQVQVSSGPLGRSGAISSQKTQMLPLDQTESIIMFRGHHALADGVSLVAAFLELCDEAEEFQTRIKSEIKKREGRAKTLLQKILMLLKRFIWFCHGSIMALSYQFKLFWTTPENPFDQVLELGSTPKKGRTVSWCDAAPIDQVKFVAKCFGSKVTVNDVWVSCVTYAIKKQLEHHRERLQGTLELPKHVTVVVPVHLGGGILPPNQKIGNFIGAFAAQVPLTDNNLPEVHSTLSWVKKTPAALLTFLLAKSTVFLPLSLKQYLFSKASANACVTVTNVRGYDKELHIEGNTVQSLAGFVPLPPGVPIGVAVQSYAGDFSLSVTAQPWAVPDADQFLIWVLEGYQRMYEECKLKTRSTEH